MFLVLLCRFHSKNVTLRFVLFHLSQNKNHNCQGKNKRRKLLLMKKLCLKSKMQQVYQIYRSGFFTNRYLLENYICCRSFDQKKKNMRNRNHKDIKSFYEVCFTLAVKIPKLRSWYMLVHSAESCVIPPFFFHLLFLVFPLSLETCNPPPLLDTHHGIIPDSMMIHWNQGDWKYLL